jgi:hypothetical protein
MDGDLEEELEELKALFSEMKLWICKVVRNKYLLVRKILDKCLIIGK